MDSQTKVMSRSSKSLMKDVPSPMSSVRLIGDHQLALNRHNTFDLQQFCNPSLDDAMAVGWWFE